MSILSLVTSTRALLTNTALIPSSSDPSSSVYISYMCNLDGSRLGPTDQPVPIYRDLYTGKYFAQVAEKIPSQNDTVSKQKREDIQALEPVHFADANGTVNGWFVPAPDFNSRESKSAPAAPVEAAPAPAAGNLANQLQS